MRQMPYFFLPWHIAAVQQSSFTEASCHSDIYLDRNKPECLCVGGWVGDVCGRATYIMFQIFHEMCSLESEYRK